MSNSAAHMVDHSSPDDVLVGAMKNGCMTSFNVLFNRYWQQLYSTAFTISRDSEISSEIVHDIFLNLWVKRERLQIMAFKGYITASARYHVYRYIRNSKRNVVEYHEEFEPAQSVSGNEGELNIRSQELQQKVKRHLNGLPKRCQEIFTLSRRDELSNDEIAERLHISKRTVENQLTHALQHLRVSLKDISWFVMFLLA